jgi:hypothetical protein
MTLLPLTYLKQNSKLDELIMDRKNIERKLLRLDSHLSFYVNKNRMNLTYIMSRRKKKETILVKNRHKNIT